LSHEALSPADRASLLGLARAAIVARLEGGQRPTRDVGPRLREHLGAFVTLTRRDDGSLRGCVGYVHGAFPLWDTVCRAAEAAATEDSRFSPVAKGELGALAIEISVLDAPRPMRPEEVEVGRHGLLVRRAGLSGLLLPQVPVEHRWDRQTFLSQTCRKAGLPADAWSDPGTELFGFTAEVFGEA
jgi:AmmeMemoRadiSam system protein A